MKMNTRVMKFRAGTFFLLIVILVIFGAIAFLGWSPLPSYIPKNPILNVAVTQARITEGKRMALTICWRCHYNDQTGTLAGFQHGNPKRLGDFYSANITRDVETGIGGWSDGQLFFFLRTGVKPNGEFIFDMPKYPNLSDEDLFSIIAFLKSNDRLVQPTIHRLPRPSYSIPIRFLLHWWLKPVPFVPTTPSPDTTDLISFGKYLATAKYACSDCHSGNAMTYNYLHPEKSWRFFQGGNPHANNQREKIYSLNITPDRSSGIGLWTEKEFLQAVKHGKKPDGTMLKDPMFPFTLLQDKEVSAIFAYLNSLTPVSNRY